MVQRRRVARARRRGLTLIEIAIVVAIAGILAALGGSLLTNLMPSWRARRAAKELAAHLSACRALAVSQDTECRVRLDTYDSDLMDNVGVGRYFVERGNASRDSTSWDILPVEDPGTTSDDRQGEGTVDIGRGGEDELGGVSIANWGALTGVAGNDIVFTPRGFVRNPAGDFSDSGYIAVIFVNGRARANGAVDDWKVRVSRGGLVRLEPSRNAGTTTLAGTASASSAGGSGSGYAP
jgi:prepilin-type N-terminal cleavage/methylation domain-containing protein